MPGWFRAADVLGLALEAQPERRVAGEVGAQHLDGHLAPQTHVAARVHVGHATAAQGRAELVAAGHHRRLRHALLVPPLRPGPRRSDGAATASRRDPRQHHPVGFNGSGPGGERRVAPSACEFVRSSAAVGSVATRAAVAAAVAVGTAAAAVAPALGAVAAVRAGVAAWPAAPRAVELIGAAELAGATEPRRRDASPEDATGRASPRPVAGLRRLVGGRLLRSGVRALQGPLGLVRRPAAVQRRGGGDGRAARCRAPRGRWCSSMSITGSVRRSIEGRSSHSPPTIACHRTVGREGAREPRHVRRGQAGKTTIGEKA